MAFTTIDEIKAANAARGDFWFSPDTMRFFRSRIVGKVMFGHYFVTSEKSNDYDAKRRYTVRYAHDDGEVTTIGEFRQWNTPDQARAAIRAHHAAGASID